MEARRSGEMDPVDLLVQIVVGTVILAPVLWLAGRGLVGKEKARLLDAIWIVLLGTVIGAVVGAFISGLVAALIMFIIWLALIKHFFDCGWLMAFAIAIVAVIIFVVIVALLALVGIGLLMFGI
jgi:hypothetical protein